MSELKNRIDFVYLFDIHDGNPNGDPDAGNLPRMDTETGEGLVTDVCLKRKVRNYVQVAKRCADGYDIFIKEKSVLDVTIQGVYNDTGEKPDATRKEMCRRFYDVRTFGAVMANSVLANSNYGQVRGPIQLTFARSVDPINSREHTITRMAVAKPQKGAPNQTMGRKATVPYALYCCHGFISANLARQTGFSEEDLNLFWDALLNMFDTDRSAARGLMSAQRLIVFKHSSELGNAPAYKLFDLVKVSKNAGCDVARNISDYSITIDKASCPESVEIIEMR